MSVAAPRLRADLAIVEQVYRGEPSFVVKDPTTHGYFRFRPVEVRVMRGFDGRRSPAEVAEALVAEGVAVSAAAVAGFARQLAKLGLLEATLRERTTQQLERLRQERRRRASLVRGELLRLRVPMGDPTRLLDVTYPWVRWCFTRGFVAASAALFAAYFAIIAGERQAFGEQVAATFSPGALEPWTLFVLVATFCVLTLLHEMGHAYACRHFGGDVREMGFMLLFFIPAFYANVNDAWSFPERRARLWVTFAGPWIELAVTAAMSIAWLAAAPGSVIAQVALASMLVGGILNILTNCNPLLPLDGYFALGDWLEIPNLRQRARALVGAEARRRLGRLDAPAPPADPHEHRILLAYGVASGLYATWILVVLASHAVSAADRALGALAAGLALLFVASMARAPVAVAADAARAAIARLRAGARAGGRWRRPALGGAAVLALAAFVPCDLTSGGGFTVVPDASVAVTAPAAGVVADVLVREGDALAAGAPVLRIASPARSLELLMHERDADSLAFGARRSLARAGPGALLADEAASAAARASAARLRHGTLRVVAAAGGVVATAWPERLVGARVAPGDTLLVLADVARLDALVRLPGAAAAEVRVGQPVRLVSAATGGRAMHGEVESVATAGGSGGLLEVRVRLAGDEGLRAGSTGEARVVVRRGTLLGAAVRAARTLVRGDLLM